jgi:hypothetical protein
MGFRLQGVWSPNLLSKCVNEGCSAVSAAPAVQVRNAIDNMRLIGNIDFIAGLLNIIS